MKIIIFGSGGQDGYYLKKLYEEKGYEVIGVSRSPGKGMQGSVTERDFVYDIIRQQMPAYVVHLAANSTTHHRALFENHETICTGTLNILEAVRLYNPACKVFLSGSAMQFLNEGKPINEQAPFHAGSAYSVARIQSVYAARYYREKFGLKLYVGYFFNHDSPLRAENHINQKIVQTVQRISNGSTERLELGNIEVRKEFGFAGDIANAITFLLNQDSVYEAVIGTGKAYSIKTWTEKCFSKVGLNWADFVDTKADFIPEYEVLVSDPELMMSLGWKPAVEIDELVDLMMLTKK